MECPKCHREASGSWCKYCGARIEIEGDLGINPYDYSQNDEYTKDNSSAYERYSQKKNANKRNSTAGIALAIVVCILAAIIFSVVISFIIKTTNTDDDVSRPEITSSAQKEDETYRELTDKALRYMEAGDYETAEKICREVIDSADDDTATEMYKILYNYNYALKEAEDFKLKAARKYFDKIPANYVNYPICNDVEFLDDEITKKQTAYEIFESICLFMEDEDYSSANDAINILNEDMLSSDNLVVLNQYKDELRSHEVKETKKEDIKKTSGSGDLSMHEAEDLLYGYCEAFVKAINACDFDIVAPYMHPDSPLYSMQKKLIEHYIAEGTTESFDSFNLESLKQVDADKWEATVCESETIYYANHTKDKFVHTWIYTIEYIDSDFYVTNLR